MFYPFISVHVILQSFLLGVLALKVFKKIHHKNILMKTIKAITEISRILRFKYCLCFEKMDWEIRTPMLPLTKCLIR